MTKPKAKYDDVAEELDGLSSSGNQVNKIEALFGDSPKLLEAIKRARSVNHHGHGKIAAFLTQRTGHRVGETSVKNWLSSQGID